MMRQGSVASIAFALVACCASSGCSELHKPFMPHSGVIPLKVWVVLADTDTYGERDNLGCRLTDNEIKAYVNQLRRNGGIFGPNVNFNWNEIPFQTVDDNLSSRTRRLMDFYATVIGGNQWQNQYLNIYFVGNVQLSLSAPGADIAITSDPAAAVRGSIIVNDGGYTLSSGIAAGREPEILQGYHLLEHEMAHYLGRFRNRCFGSGVQQRCYDQYEHLGVGANCILAPNKDEFGEPLPCPLIVPGRADEAGTEKHEIWLLVDSGAWNSP